jgi:hypothetical protein
MTRRHASIVGAVAVVLLMISARIGAAEPVTTIRNNGPSSNRVDLVVLGDGYTAAEIASGKYAADVENAVAGFFAQQPYAEYSRYFNVQRIDVTSNQSGADKPQSGIFRDTAFDATYYCGQIQRLICVDTNKVNNAISRSISDPNAHDMILVLVNDLEYGGSGGAVAVASLQSSVIELVLHETGHSFGLLADEYTDQPPTCSLVEPSEANATTNIARASIKWKNWVDPSTPLPTTTAGVVGAYQGARYCPSGMYRPTFNSKMRSLDMPFEQVNTEQIVRRIYSYVHPIDSALPAGSVSLQQGQTQAFSISAPQPQTHAMDVAWTVDGAQVATGAAFTLGTTALSVGTHSVVATVSDATSYVRSDPSSLLRGTHSWSVTVTPAPGTLIAIDAPAAGATVTPPFTVSGWAVRPTATTGTGVSAVHVYIQPNGGALTFVGVATYGLARADIGALYGSQFTNSGFTLSAGSGLPAGGYTVLAYAQNASTGTFDAVASVAITVTPPHSDPHIAVDYPTPGLVVTSAFEVAGWALDAASAAGTGVDSVQFYIIPAGASAGVFIGTGSYGKPRADLAAIYGSRFTNCGFHFTITGLGPGAYTLSVLAHSTVTGSYSIVQNVPVTVSATALMSIDAPSPEQNISASSFLVGGWSIDRNVESTGPTGTGVDALHIYAYPNPGSGQPAIFLGVGTMGVARPDVGAAYGSRYNASGYSLIVDRAAAGLAPGVYNIVVASHSSVSGTFNNLAVVQITLQ